MSYVLNAGAPEASAPTVAVDAPRSANDSETSTFVAERAAWQEAIGAMIDAGGGSVAVLRRVRQMSAPASSASRR